MEPHTDTEIKTGCLFDLPDPAHFVQKKKKKALSGSLIGHILEAALGLDQYYCAWRVSPPQSKEPPTLTPAPKNPTGKTFCPPLLIKNSPANNAEGESELSYFLSVL